MKNFTYYTGREWMMAPKEMITKSSSNIGKPTPVSMHMPGRHSKRIMVTPTNNPFVVKTSTVESF